MGVSHPVGVGELAWLRLGGNALTGCIPSSLRSVADHDLHRLRALSDC